MKTFAFFVLLAVVSNSVIADDDKEACKAPCFNQPYVPVCSKGIGTFWNVCELKCEKAELTHVGECKYIDLMDNRLME